MIMLVQIGIAKQARSNEKTRMRKISPVLPVHDRKGQNAPLFNLGGEPARPVHNVIFNTHLTMETEEKP
eukprot:9560314-Ditylum_brightwellii.AAC.1